MTMTPDTLAELDAVMAKATAGEWAAKMWDSPYKIGIWANDGADYKTCTPIATGRAKAPDKRLLDELHLIAYEREQVPIVEANISAIVALHNAYPLLTATIDAQAAEIARLQAERVFVLGAGECVTNWGTYGGEPCVFLEPLVGAKGVQGELVPDSEKHDPHLLRNGSVVLVLRGEPTAFMEDIATARAQENIDV